MVKEEYLLVKVFQKIISVHNASKDNYIDNADR